MSPILKHSNQNIFGSATFMSGQELTTYGLHKNLPQEANNNKFRPYLGVYNGAFSYGYGQQPVYAPTDGEGHVLTIAPRQTGKDATHIITNLLTWKGSCLVIDVNGSNYLHSSGFRGGSDLGNLKCSVLNQKIFKFAPFDEHKHVWNPLLFIHADYKSIFGTLKEEEQARYLADLLIFSNENVENSRIVKKAKSFLEGLLLYVRTCNDTPFLHEDRHIFFSKEDEHLKWRCDKLSPDCIVRERSIFEVRRLLSLSKENFTELLNMMIKSKRSLIINSAQYMKNLIEDQSKIGYEVLSILLEETKIWAYKRVHDSTYYFNPVTGLISNDFDLKDLYSDLLSIYVIFPQEHIEEYNPVLRVFLGIATQSIQIRKKELISVEKSPILFILDEFTQLGNMNFIENILNYDDNYGILFWFFINNIAQLQSIYPKSWQNFMANTDIHTYFGINDLQTAKLISEMLGTYTALNLGFSNSFGKTIGKSRSNTNGKSESTTVSTGDSSSTDSEGKTSSGSTSSTANQYGTSESITEGTSSSEQTNLGVNVNFIGRALMTHDEVLKMPDHEQIVFIRGCKPIRCLRTPYFDLKSISPQEIDSIYNRAKLPIFENTLSIDK